MPVYRKHSNKWCDNCKGFHNPNRHNNGDRIQNTPGSVDGLIKFLFNTIRLKG